MGAHWIHDLCVVSGTYQKDGQSRNKYQKIGVEMENDDGGHFIVLERFINLAGFPDPDNRGTVMVSKFDKREGGDQAPATSQSAPPPRAPSAPAQHPAAPPAPRAPSSPASVRPNRGPIPQPANDDYGEDIPFD